MFLIYGGLIEDWFLVVLRHILIDFTANKFAGVHMLFYNLNYLYIILCFGIKRLEIDPDLRRNLVSLRNI